MTKKLKINTIANKIKKSSPHKDVVDIVIGWMRQGIGLFDASLDRNGKFFCTAESQYHVPPPKCIANTLLNTDHANVLIRILKNSEFEEFRKLSGDGNKDINEFQIQGWGIMHLAAFHNSPQMIEYLVSAGVKIDVPGSWTTFPTSPLGVAVRCGMEKSTLKLSQLGADWNRNQRLKVESGHSIIEIDTAPWVSAWFQPKGEILKESIKVRGLPSQYEWNNEKTIPHRSTKVMKLENVITSACDRSTTMTWWKEAEKSKVYESRMTDEERDAVNAMVGNASKSSFRFNAFGCKIEAPILMSKEASAEHGIGLIEAGVTLAMLKDWFKDGVIKDLVESEEFKEKVINVKSLDRNLNFNQNIKLWTAHVLKRPDLLQIFRNHISNEMAINFWIDIHTLVMKQERYFVSLPRNDDLRKPLISKKMKQVLESHFNEAPEIKTQVLVALWGLIGMKKLDAVDSWKGLLQWGVDKNLVPAEAVLNMLATASPTGYRNEWIEREYEEWKANLERGVLSKTYSSEVKRKSAVGAAL